MGCTSFYKISYVFFQKINNEGLSTHKGYRAPQKIYRKFFEKIKIKIGRKNPKSRKKRKNPEKCTKKSKSNFENLKIFPKIQIYLNFGFKSSYTLT